ncbi:MAG: hypothetical protein PQJ58_01555 [Spirochaetales bacterium]|nr:hypothetical protein [Spirochaetales bacterium]
MNIDKLKKAEQDFMLRYPGGFQDPEMVAIGKKHKMDKMVALAAESFGEDRFSNGEELAEKYIKIVTSSSMVSVFEKPRTRDFIRSLSSHDRDHLTNSLYEMLYLDEETGFNGLLDVLSMGKLAKWTLMTVVPAYLRPEKDVFIKPTTAKGILKFLEVEDLVYRPRPSYQFYSAYRDLINELKTHADPSLSPSNAAFSGFLMMSMEA